MDEEYTKHVCLMYRGKTIIGYVHSSKEADWICDKLDDELQWDFCSKKQMMKISSFKFLTIHDF